MLERDLKIKIIISLVSLILMLPVMGYCAAVIESGKQLKHTARITFFKNSSGDLMAEIIPTSSRGNYARSGCTICEVIASDIKEKYTEKIRNLKRFKGYFVATYRIIEKDKHSVVRIYKGELLKIESWNPPFIKK
jgi:hypothetical protein